ncbi:MAG: hypothetical protein E7458_09435 [Ruminococcaceae bacterium]|nr:hypothetical protein [Oscillospiraceae bacterium]
MKSLRRILPAFTIFFAAGSILFLLLVIGILFGRAEAAMPREESSPPIEAAAVLPETDPLPVYTIRLRGGELQLSHPGTPDRYTVLSGIDPRTLRSADRDALTAGVTLPSMEAVVRFLEDYSS